MPDLDIIVSQMPSAVQDNSSDLVMLTQPNAQAETGYSTAKETLENIAKKAVHGIEYETLLANFPSGKRNPTDALNELNNAIENMYPVNTASGSIANFTTSLVRPLTALSSTIVAQQAGSGTPSPQNVRSISGVSSVKFRHTEKSTVVANVVGEYVSENGVITQTSAAFPYKSVIARVEQGETYTYSVNGVATAIPVFAFFTSYPDIGMVSYNNERAVRGDATFIAPIDGFIFIRGNADFDEVNQMVSKGSTVTAYEDGNTFTIQLGQTVYGGVIDAKRGKLRVTWGSSDLGSLNWTRDAESVPSNPYFFSQKNITKTSTPNVLCSIYQVSNTSVANMPNYSIKADGNGRIIVINQDYTDASSFKTAMAGIIVVYELATPEEIDITANNFTTINGEQNIFSDCGEVTVGFKQGIQEYIDAQIAATQALVLNS